MCAKFRVKGMDEVLNNLNAEFKGMKGRLVRGMIKAAIIVRRDMEHSMPYTPVDLGNLRQSWYIATHYGLADGSSPAFRPDKKGTKSSVKRASKMAREHRTITNDAATEVIGMGKNLRLIMGFSANYAKGVHELTAQTNWSRPGSGPWFFKTAVSRNEDRMITIIAKEGGIDKSRIRIG